MPAPFIVYIVRCADGSLYIGKTANLAWRLRRHNDGTGCEFTRTRRPVSLAWSEVHPEFRAAEARERQIKKWTRAKKEALVRGDFAELKRLSRSRDHDNRDPSMSA